MAPGPLAEEAEGSSAHLRGNSSLEAHLSVRLPTHSPSAAPGGVETSQACESPTRAIDRDFLMNLEEAELAVASDGALVLVNPAAASLWGWQADELLGQPVRVLLGDSINLAQTRHQRIHTKHKVVHRVTAEDVAEDADYLQLSAIVDLATFPIIACSRTGEILKFNKAAAQVFGLSQVEAKGGDVLQLFVSGAASGRPAAEVLEEYVGCSGREERGVRQDGSTFPMRVNASKVVTKDCYLFMLHLEDITQELAHKESLLAEQRKTAAIMNSALNAIITTDSRGAIELINASACRIFGVDQQNPGNLASLLLLEDEQHPSEENMGAYLHEVAGTVRELQGCRVDGSTFPMRMSVSEVNSEGQHLFTAILRDVTKEKEDQARLNAANQIIKLEKSKLQALLDSTVEGFIVVNSVGLIESFNKSAVKIFGYDVDEVVGCNVSMLMAGKHARRHDKYLRRYLRKGKGAAVVGHAREVTAMRKSGAEFQILLSISETVVSGEHYFTAVVRDLSNELLLLNMLPMSIAARLKANEGPIHDGHENVSILFADICGFTSLSSTLTPFEVVSFLNDIFHDFDELADRYRLEKIKTIGDCYMVVSGLPESCELHALKLACFAIEMREALLRYNERSSLDQPLSMRIGMHSGPVIAGVVGKRKFLYDIWGDAVNVASRMESTGRPGEIHVSNDLKAQLEDWFDLEDCGMTAVKGKGDMHTWILKTPLEHAERLLLHQLLDVLAAADNTLEVSTSAWSIADLAEDGPKLGPVFRALRRKHWPEDTEDSTMGHTTISRMSIDSELTEVGNSKDAIALSFSRQRKQIAADSFVADGIQAPLALPPLTVADKSRRDSNPPLIPAQSTVILPTLNEVSSYRDGLCQGAAAPGTVRFRGDSVDTLLPRLSSSKPVAEPKLEVPREADESLTLPSIPATKQHIKKPMRGSKVVPHVLSVSCWDRGSKVATESSSRGCGIM